MQILTTHTNGMYTLVPIKTLSNVLMLHASMSGYQIAQKAVETHLNPLYGDLEYIKRNSYD